MSRGGSSIGSVVALCGLDVCNDASMKWGEGRLYGGEKGILGWQALRSGVTGSEYTAGLFSPHCDLFRPCS